MELKEINIDLLKIDDLNIKQGNHKSYLKIKQSLEQYGQIYPVLVTVDEYGYVILKGKNVIKAMRELNMKTVWTKIIIIDNEIDQLKFKKHIYDTQDNIDILKLSLVIKKLNTDYSINEISDRTGIQVEELINYLDLLKLDNLIKTKEENKQPKLF